MNKFSRFATTALCLFAAVAANAEPYSFIYDGKRYSGFEGTIDGALKVSVVRGADAEYSEREYTVWFENVSDKPSAVLEQVVAYEDVMKGESPVLRGILGDHVNFYKPYEYELEKGNVGFTNLLGRATHITFPYFDLVHGDGGTRIAIGWAGTWQADFAAENGGVRVRLKSCVGLAGSLMPGEKIRTAQIALLDYPGRDESTGVNRWRRWFRKNVLPKADASGSPLKPFSTFCFAGDTGLPNMDGSVSETYFTFPRTFARLKHEKLLPDFRWFDAGWYVTPDGKSVPGEMNRTNNWWTTVGTWTADPAKWPKGTLRETTDTGRAHGMKILCWFEPERVTHVDSLVKNWGYKYDWTTGGNAVSRLNNLGDPACLKWTLDRIVKMMDENGIDFYREDNNADQNSGWKYFDGRDAKRYGVPRRGMSENLGIQGHYALWDGIIDYCRRSGKCTFVDSCASGGGRNDLESLRRGFPLLRSDYDRTTIAMRLSQTWGFCKWVPFHGSSTKETKGQLEDMVGRVPDAYIIRASLLPVYNWGGLITHDPAFDCTAYRRNLELWKSVNRFLTEDYYALTPWTSPKDTSQCTALAYHDPKSDSAIVLAFRGDTATADRLTVKLPFVDAAKTYAITDDDRPGVTRRLSGAELRVGLEISLPNPRTSVLLRLCLAVAPVSSAGTVSASTGKVFGEAVRLPGSESMAMAVALEGNLLYSGERGKIVVYDVSDPLKARRLGAVDGLGNVRQIVVQNGFVYASARESGLWIVDARNPAAPRIRSRFDCCELATGIDVAGRIVFLGQRQNGVEFIDVSDPDHPEHIAMRKTDESQSVIYRDGYVYSGDWGSGHLTVFDAHDMRNIRQVAYEPLWGFGDGIWKRGNILYASTGHHAVNRDFSTLPFKSVDTPEIRVYGKLSAGSGCGHGLDLFDVSDPSHPRRLGRADFPPFFARGLDMWTPRTSSASETVFCVQTHNGLFAVDCSDTSKPRVLDRWTFPVKAHPEWPSCCLASVAVGHGCVYVAGQGCGVVAIPAKGAAPETVDKGTPPANVSFREPYPTDADSFYVWKNERAGQARAVALNGDTVYAACGEAGLYVLKIKPEGDLTEIGSLPGGRKVFDVAFENGRLYTAEGLDGFACYELSGVTGFREIARRGWLDSAHDPALCIYKPCVGWIGLSTRRAGIWIFRDDNWLKGSPLVRLSGCPGWDKYLMDKPVGNGRWLGYNGGNSYVSWIDFENKAKETRGSPKSRLSLTNGLGRFDENRAIATKNGGYFFLDGGITEAPGHEAMTPIPFPGKRMNGMPRVSKGRRVVLTNRIGRKIGLWDFSDEAHPRLIKFWNVSGNPDLAVFYGERFIVPCGHQGVIMLKSEIN